MKLKIFMFLLAFCVVFSGCTNSVQKEVGLFKLSQVERNALILERADTKRYLPFLKKGYSQTDLLKSLNFGMSDNMNTDLYYIDEKYTVKYLRSFGDSLPYCIYKLKEGGKLFVFFHSGLKADNVFIVKNKLSQSNFKELKAGDSITEVEKIDEGIGVLNSNTNEIILGIRDKTYHMVKEGFVIIRYDNYLNTPKNNLRIKSIKFIPNGGRLEAVNTECFEHYFDYPNDSDEYSPPNPEGYKYYFLPEDY